MHNTTIRGAFAALALGALAGGSFAAEPSYRQADTNKDGFVSRAEYVDHMTKVWDEHHMSMMKSDKTWKKDMMSDQQFDDFYQKSISLPSGRLNPGKVGG